ncbi:hypothetical protein B0I37DRAFT_356433 [Chaetomium sp. MPI-CAGE-AT-0009]|nr:hypothetical protein B0I37DRAFT_356433 [Chaetomium sp. MPI-CAGE-AT-0009]
MRLVRVLLALSALATPAFTAAAPNSTAATTQVAPSTTSVPHLPTESDQYVCSHDMDPNKDPCPRVEPTNSLIKPLHILTLGLSCLAVIALDYFQDRAPRVARVCVVTACLALAAWYVAAIVVPEHFDIGSDGLASVRLGLVRLALTIGVVAGGEAWDMPGWVPHVLRWVQEAGLVYEMVGAMTMAPPRPTLQSVVGVVMNFVCMLRKDLSYLKRWWGARGRAQL